jgi:hypothetical protein
MISFNFNSNSKIVNSRLSNMVARQMPFAISKALNDTAKALVVKNKKDMARIFNNPVPFTLNAFYFIPARKYESSVTIKRKDKAVGKHYLEVQQDGGIRPQTGFERALENRLPYGGIVKHATPTSGAPKNKYGNMSPGFRNQMMSALQLQRDPAANSKKFGRTNKGSREFFVPKPDHPLGRGKKAGVYQRYASGKIKKVLNFIDHSLNYRPRLRFDERMQLYGSNMYPKRLQLALRHAMQTARMK